MSEGRIVERGLVDRVLDASAGRVHEEAALRHAESRGGDGGVRLDASSGTIERGDHNTL